MYRTIKEATVKKYYYETHEKIKDHIHSFIYTYYLDNRLKALKDLTVLDYINKCWNEEPDNFKTIPLHLFAGLYLCEFRDFVPLLWCARLNFYNVGKF